MFARKKLLVSIGLVLFIGGMARGLDLPWLPPLLIFQPDLKIEKFDAHRDPLSKKTFVEIEVKNRGYKALNASVRVVATIEYPTPPGTETVDVDTWIAMSIPARDSVLYNLASLPNEDWPDTIAVSGTVDPVYPPSLTGYIVEIKEWNNSRSTSLVKDGLGYNGD